MVKLLDRQRAYASHPDPATAAGNVVALAVAWNLPFYPLYAVALIGRDGWALYLTVLAAPFFFSVPWLSRRYPTMGRAALPLIGMANSAFSFKLFGSGAGMELFFLPCIVLAGLLFRPGERWLALTLIGTGLAAVLMPAAAWGPPVIALASAQLGVLAAINLASVAALCGLVALLLRGVLAPAEAAATPRPDPAPSVAGRAESR